jgi:hypothetical protein
MGSILKFTEHSFSKKIEKLVIEKNISYIDAILSICEEEQLEPDSVTSLLSIPIKERLMIEGQELNILKKGNTASLDFS